MKKKKLIIIISIVSFILILILLSIFLRPNYDNQIVSYINNLGFEKDDGGLYSKKLSEKDLTYFDKNKDELDILFDKLSFNIYSYIFTENKYESTDGVKLYFNGFYDYKTKKLTYNYRILYKTSNAIYKGSYDRKNKELECNVEFAYNTTIDDNKEKVCETVQDNIDEFISHINEFINKPKLLEYMESKANNEVIK